MKEAVMGCGWKGPGFWKRMFLKVRVRACADVSGREESEGARERRVNPPSDEMRMTLTLDGDPAPPQTEWKGNAYGGLGWRKLGGRACLALEIENRHW